MGLNELRKNTLSMLRPPRDDSVAIWADRNRILTSEASAEPGPWRTSRAPHQREPMEAFTQRGIRRIVLQWGSQTGKSEVLLNCMGRTIELDPCSMMYVQPNDQLSEDFSKRRVAPMISATKVLTKLVAEAKGRDSSNTIGMKTFPGGNITFTGAQSPRNLASKPIRKLFLDEIDGFPASAGTEGDPIKLAEKRTTTYSDATIVMCSTPGLKGESRIDKEYRHGTQEEWSSECPHCKTYHYMRFDDIRYTTEKEVVDGENHIRVTSAKWCCPSCHRESDEYAMRRAPAKYIAKNPKALKRGIRSFKINALGSPWGNWIDVCQKFEDAGDDQHLLQVFYNTELAEPYEYQDRSGAPETLYARREPYAAEVPDGPLVLTMGVDTQGDRLEYEVVGWAQDEESWGIERGYIPGRADTPEPWRVIDELLERKFHLANGRSMRIGMTFIDSGGNHTQDVYRQCERRANKRIYPIKGDDGFNKPYVSASKKALCKKTVFIIGVDSGKEAIYDAVSLQEPGPRYMHFPDDEAATGYSIEFFRGLLSEKMEYRKVRGKLVIGWTKVYERNEPLDCRDYARAAWYAFRWPYAELREKLYGKQKITRAEKQNADGTKKSKHLVSAGVKV